MSGIFQGYTNSNGRVRTSEVTKVPSGSANDRGMIVAGNRVIPYLLDGGQPRTLHDGIAFDSVTGMLLAADTPFGSTNISMGGLLVDSRGAVMLTNGTPQVIHQGVGLQNNGRLSIESEPIATFIAWLGNNVASTTGPGTFTRNSDGLYLPVRDWRSVGNDINRHEDGMLLMEPAITNKCTNYNANPDTALTNITKLGDAAAVLRRVSDQGLIERSGLSNICTSGFVVELDNSAGSAAANARIEGQVGTLTTHAVSAFGVSVQGASRVGIGGVGDAPDFPTGLVMERRVFAGTAVNVQNRCLVTADAGSICRFVLNQLEELPVVTSPIVTQGAAGSRAIDALSWAGVSTFFPQAQGMAILKWRPKYSKAQFSGLVESLLTVDAASRANLLYFDTAFRSRDGTNTAAIATPTWVSGDEMYVASLWGPTGASALNVGYKLNNDAWQWGAATAYDGSFDAAGDDMTLNKSTAWPHAFGEITIFNENRGQAWIEANYP